MSILVEIRTTREKQAAECDFDPKRIGARMRVRQKARAVQGVRYVSFARRSTVPREGPPLQP